MSWKLKEKNRLILAKEEGYKRKSWGDVLKVCLAYPNRYHLGMANLGYQAVYYLFNQHPRCLCERVFLPDSEDEEDFIRSRSPLFSMESERPLKDFDILAFSLSFENDYPHVLKMLTLAGMSLLAHERNETDPFVLGGGIAVTLNPEPLAVFFDLFLIGEGEEVIHEFIELFLYCREQNLKKEETLFHLQQWIEGAYIPRFYQVSYDRKGRLSGFSPCDNRLPSKIKRRRLPDLNTHVTVQRIYSEDTEFGSMSLLEISRGCARGCRFCAAGFVFRPARFRKAELLEEFILETVKKGKKVGLLGTAVSDHPQLMNILGRIGELKGEVALASLRVDRVSSELLALLKRGGIMTLSLAPEAGSQRLRDLINKGIDEEQIKQAVEAVTHVGIPNLKFYFMVGLPTENEKDVEAIAKLIRKIKHWSAKISAGKSVIKRIVISLNQFVPKACTPFQWYPLADVKMVEKRTRWLKETLRKEDNIRVLHDVPKWNYLQALFSLGDRRVGEILLTVHRNGGNWMKALRESPINPDFFVYRPKEEDEFLPWDFIDHGIDKSFLLKEYQKSRNPYS